MQVKNETDAIKHEIEQNKMIDNIARWVKMNKKEEVIMDNLDDLISHYDDLHDKALHNKNKDAQQFYKGKILALIEAKNIIRSC